MIDDNFADPLTKVPPKPPFEEDKSLEEDIVMVEGEYEELVNASHSMHG